MSTGAWKRIVREAAKSALAQTFVASGLLPIIAAARLRLGGPRVHILAFHRVVDDMARLARGVIPSLCISTATFERLCRLAREHFDVLPLADAAEVVLGRRRARRDVVAITFDDGYRDVYLRALPVLRRLELPATAFIPTGYIDSARLLGHDRLFALLERAGERRLGLIDLAPSHVLVLAQAELALRETGAADALDVLIAGLPAAELDRLAGRLAERLGGPEIHDEGARVMSAGELRACADAGIELGAHTVDHVALVHEPPARMRRELEAPRAALEAISGRPCRSFAFCNGLWHPALLPVVRAAGYEVAVTTYDAPNLVGQDPLLLNRKTLWEGHASGAFGARSDARLLAHLYHLYGDLALTRPVSGRVERARGEGHLGCPQPA